MSQLRARISSPIFVNDATRGSPDRSASTSTVLDVRIEQVHLSDRPGIALLIDRVMSPAEVARPALAILTL